MLTVGCGKPDPSSPVVLANNDQYAEANKAAAGLAAGPFEKIDAGEPLKDEDRRALRDAIRDWDGMVAFAPDRPAPLFTSGQAKAALGDYNGAIRSFQQFITSVGPSPEQPDVRVMAADAHYLTGTSKVALKDYAAAVTDFNAALALEPSRPEYLAERAGAELQLGRKGDAGADLRKALAIDPSNRRAQGLSKLIRPGGR